MPVKSNERNLEAPTVVESIIKRKHGTVVPFGHAAHRRTEYHFLPIDPLSPDSPHVCDVPNDEHRAKLLAIKEGFRLFNKPKQQDPDGDNQDGQYQDDQDGEDDENGHDPDEQAEGQQAKGGVDYEDMLGLNADEVSTDFLKAYAKDHLKISSTAKAPVIAYAKENYGLDLDGTATVINLLRGVMKAEQAQQRKASEAAELANK